MARSLTVDNTTYNFPEQGEDPTWGEVIVNWAEAVSDVLNNLQGPGDILETTFTIANNQSSSADVTGLSFSNSTVRAAFVEYSVYRESDTTTNGKAESGSLFLVYDDNASSGNKWIMSQDAAGNSGVTFTVADTGQISYTSDDIGSTGYSGTMKFKARTL